MQFNYFAILRNQNKSKFLKRVKKWKRTKDPIKRFPFNGKQKLENFTKVPTSICFPSIFLKNKSGKTTYFLLNYKNANLIISLNLILSNFSHQTFLTNSTSVDINNCLTLLRLVTPSISPINMRILFEFGFSILGLFSQSQNRLFKFEQNLKFILTCESAV